MDREPAACLLVREQLAVADSKQRTAKDRHQGDLVLWVGERPKKLRQRVYLARLAESAGAADFNRDSQRLEGVGVCADPALLPREDQKIAVLASPCIHLIADEPGDLGGIVNQYLA